MSLENKIITNLFGYSWISYGDLVSLNPSVLNQLSDSYLDIENYSVDKDALVKLFAIEVDHKSTELNLITRHQEYTLVYNEAISDSDNNSLVIDDYAISKNISYEEAKSEIISKYETNRDKILTLRSIRLKGQAKLRDSKPEDVSEVFLQLVSDLKLV